MVDSVGATQRLHRTVLAWDYWDVNEKLDEEGGVFSSLRAVPSTFSSMKVCPYAPPMHSLHCLIILSAPRSIYLNR